MADKYEGIDGLKAYSIVGIVLMHVLVNGNYVWSGFIFHKLIPSFTNLVFAFMMVSGFGMCCGYYQKFLDQKISLKEFYSRRYNKIWPFFATLSILDLVISPSKSALYEVFANLTLCQGLLPNMNISVIGVSWTLAVIFVFYLFFPFFCFLLENKKRAWLALICCFFYNLICSKYFFNDDHISNKVAVNFSPRTNFIYCAVYFMTGGIIFLYRKKLSEFALKFKVTTVVILIITTILYFVIGETTFTLLALFSIFLICCLGCKQSGILNNPITKFLSRICLEIYLCHMLIFRILEKTFLIHIFGKGLLAYVFTTVTVICGSVLFSICTNYLLKKIKSFLL